MLRQFLSRFDYNDHITNLASLDLCLPTSFTTKEDPEITAEIEEAKEKQIRRTLTNKEQKLKKSIQLSDKKFNKINRKPSKPRKCFEDASTPKILTTDKRLDGLQQYKDLNKKTPKKTLTSSSQRRPPDNKANEDKIDHITPKKTSSSSRRKTYDDKIDGYNMERKKRKVVIDESCSVDEKSITVELKRQKVEFSLQTIIPELNDVGSSKFILETATQEVHDLYLPLSFETSTVKAKKEIVSLSVFRLI